LNKADYLLWSRKYDKSMGWQLQKEKEIGARLRRTKVLTKQDLLQIVEWKLKDAQEKKQRVLELIARNDEATITRLSSQALSIPSCEDGYRMNCLTLLEGVSPVIASVVLAFFDPKQYCILDAVIWKALLGNPPPNMLTTQNYLKLLMAIRKSAAKQNLDVRTIDKAVYKKSLDESR
jgi:hypothetical protein